MAISQKHEMTSHWKSKTGFLFAAVGGAIGLGNIWRFPFEAGQNGGAAFVIIYVAFVIIIGFPLLSAETMLGRYGKQGAVTNFGHVASMEGKSQNWKYIGWFIASSSFILCSYYSVIAGTTAAYAVEAVMGSFKDITPDGAVELYASYSESPLKLTFWHAFFMGICAITLSRQLNDGIEKLTSIAMPVFFALLIALIIMAAVIGDFSAGAAFLFEPDFSKVNVEMVISALGQAFFSIGVALGIMLTFGAYLPEDTSIVKSAFIICIADTMVAVFAGLTIFPIVFGFGMEPNVGPALVFNTMTVAFGQLEYGGIIATGFFSLLAIAGFTTLLALMEQMVSYLNKFYEMKRSKAANMVTGAVFVVGMLSVFSTNILASVQVAGMNLMDTFDWWINQVGLPLGGLFTAVFAGWVLSKQSFIKGFGEKEKHVGLLYVLIRYFCPVAILIVFVSQFVS
ncbi:MAG: sodium-dependent transporter [Kordiimonadaceae bacterium]|jgi:neurotransmitter:Na+ symporter, NSS family|nr:sodium-dependent transporter [Kordiimonadaceae bacterium]MBT6032172.1 sodium-dependent transporter [Kordiimonadaceae bacterium]